MQRLVTLGGNVGLDAFRVHDAAVGEHDGKLFGKERAFGIAALDLCLAALERANEGGRVFGVDLQIERAMALGVHHHAGFFVRIHLHERPLAAKFHAAHAAHFHVVFQAGVLHGLFEALLDRARVGRHAARGHAAADDKFFPPGAFLFRDFVEVVNYHGKSILSRVRERFPLFAAG